MAFKQARLDTTHTPNGKKKKKKKIWCTVSSHYRVHQRAGCILVRLKRWLSTELPSKVAAPSSAWSAWLCPFLQPERFLAAARLHAG